MWRILFSSYQLPFKLSVISAENKTILENIKFPQEPRGSQHTSHPTSCHSQKGPFPAGKDLGASRTFLFCWSLGRCRFGWCSNWNEDWQSCPGSLWHSNQRGHNQTLTLPLLEGLQISYFYKWQGKKLLKIKRCSNSHLQQYPQNLMQIILAGENILRCNWVVLRTQFLH